VSESDLTQLPVEDKENGVLQTVQRMVSSLLESANLHWEQPDGHCRHFLLNAE